MPEFAVVRQLAGPGSDPLGGLDEAAAAGFLDEDTAGVFTFRHALVRHAVYEAMSRSRRAELHRRAADAIAVVRTGDGLHLCDVAEHRCAAVPLAEASEAVAAARRATTWAVDNGAYDRAVLVLTKALPLAEGTDRRRLQVQRAIAFQRLYHELLGDDPA